MTELLMVEDDVQVGGAMIRMLKREGHTVAWAKDERAARWHIAGSVLGYLPRYACALVDLELDLDIKAGARVVYALPRRIRPIVVSGHDVQEVRRQVEVPFSFASGLFIDKGSEKDKERLLQALKQPPIDEPK